MSDLSKQIEERVSKSFDAAEELNKKLQAEYILALDEINKHIAYFYSKYAGEKGITYTEAVMYLNKLEMIPFGKKLSKYKKILDSGNVELAAKIDALALKSRITRLEALTTNIQYELILLQNTQQEKLTNHLTDTYASTYAGAASELTSVGFKASFVKINPELVKEAISFPWSGQSFSEAIWNNTDALVSNMHRELTQGFIQGTSVQKMAKNISKRMNVGYGQAVRLVATETAHVISKASLQQYRDSGIKKVEFSAVLDNRTSSICEGRHGTYVFLENAVVGKNIPPLHPHCRSTILPVVDDEEAVLIDTDI